MGDEEKGKHLQGSDSGVGEQADRKKNYLIRTVLSAVAIIVLAQLPLWLLRPYTVLPQPLFELDLLLATALFSYNRSVGRIAVVVAWSLSLLRAVAINYHFENPAEFVDSLRFAGLLSYSAFITPQNLLIASVMVLLILVIFRGMVATRANARAVLVLTVLAGAADILNGSGTSIAMGRDLRFMDVNILGSPSYNLVATEQKFLQGQSQLLTPLQPVPRSYAVLRASAVERREGNLLLLVESLGLPLAREVRDWLVDQLRTPKLLANWDFDEGAEAFDGGTVAGELRVLCGLRGHYSRLTETQSQDCLPRLFRAQGEGVMAMHGFSPRMFDRARWWPIAGFDQVRFGDQLFGEKGVRCPGAFNGICDHDLIAAALQRVAERKQFVYALTINTHLPLPEREVGAGLSTLCQRNSLPDASCQFLQEQGKLLADLASQLVSASCQINQVVVVGDHSPPFSNFRDRRVFDAKKVLSLILRRRNCV